MLCYVKKRRKKEREKRRRRRKRRSGYKFLTFPHVPL